MNFGLWIILTAVFSLLSLVSVAGMIRYDLKKDSSLSLLITGLVTVPDGDKETEMRLRNLAAYIKKNEIRCFRKIYIKVNDNDTENMQICRSLCEQYSFYELLGS